MPAALLVLLAAVCFGTTGTAQAFAPAGADSVSIGAARLAAGGLLLGGYAWWAARRGATQPARAPLRVGTLAVVAVGALGVLAYQPTFFIGARSNGVAVGTVIALGSAPLFTGLLEWVWFRRRPSRRWVLATGLAVAGVALLSGIGGHDGAGLLGPLASLAAGASYALYAVAIKALLEAGWGSTSAVGAVFGLGGVLAVPLALTTDPSWLADPRGMLVLGWLAVVTVLIAYLLYGAGLRHLPAATASTLTLAEPATASLLGVLVLSERLDVLGWVGVAVIAVAIGVLALGERTSAVTNLIRLGRASGF